MNAIEYVDSLSLKSVLRIPDEALDHVFAKAYQLFQSARYSDVEILCRGLIAVDQRYWWSYALYSAALHKLGRLKDALSLVDRGLEHEPSQPRLLLLRSRVLAALGRGEEARADLVTVTSKGRFPEQLAAGHLLSLIGAE